MEQRIVVVTTNHRFGAGVTRALREACPDRDVLTADSNRSALSVCGALPLSVVILDGAAAARSNEELLDELMLWHPGVACVVLGGDPPVVDGPVRHLPSRSPRTWDLDEAVQAATQDAAVRARPASSNSRARMPAGFATWTRLRAMLADPEVGVREVAALVGGDQATTGRLMAWANGVARGRSRRVVDLEEAVVAMGLKAVADLVLSVEAGIFLEPLRGLPGLSVDQLRRHALGCGVLARELVTDRSEAADAFTAAVLQNAGLLSLVSTDRDGTAARVAQAAAEQQPLHLVERRTLGHDHADVGSGLLVMWQLPEGVSAAVAGFAHPARPGPTAVPAGAGPAGRGSAAPPAQLRAVAAMERPGRVRRPGGPAGGVRRRPEDRADRQARGTGRRGAEHGVQRLDRPAVILPTVGTGRGGTCHDRPGQPSRP